MINKVALITGTSKGIGLVTALAFGRAGYKVFASMRNPTKTDDFRQRINSESLDIHILEMDVDSDTSVKECIHGINQEQGQIDVLVNNAGIERHGSTADSHSQ